MTRRRACSSALSRLAAVAAAAWLLAPVVPAQAMSEKQEIEIGRQMHPKILQQYGRYGDEELQQYVSEIGRRIAAKSDRPSLEYTFTVLDSEEVNAFALPGGYVYITRGIMAYLNSEAELVAVLGHEIGHVTAKHAARQQRGSTASAIGATLIGVLTGSPDLAQVANLAGTALVRGYGRDMELEADSLGAEYLARLGHDPEAMIDVVRLLKNQELLELQAAREEGRDPRVYHGVFSTHPDNDKRLREVIETAGAKGGAAAITGQSLDPGREPYLRRIDQLPLGSSREQGVVRGSRYYHADMGFTLAFPSGWSVQNLPNKVLGMSPNKDAMLQIMVQAPAPGMGPRELLAAGLKGVPTSDAEPLEVNGQPGYTAIARNVPLLWGNRGPARYAVIYHNNLGYVFTGATRLGGALSATDALILSSIKTFRRLNDREYALAEPRKLKLIEATEATRMSDLARESPLPKYPLERLRLLNDLYPDKEPKAGQTIKVVQ
jgi:predicted Zn-dependent protease